MSSARLHIDEPPEKEAATPILRISNLTKTFAVRRSLRDWPRARRRLTAVDRVSLEVDRGEVLGIVGESGSGKSTLARCVVGLERADAGEFYYAGRQVDLTRRDELSKLRTQIQMVFQDPGAALNPRMTIGAAIREASDFHGTAGPAGSPAFINNLLELVGLSPELQNRRPRQLSGGQRQRAVIARALAVRPQVLIADEAVSALDVSVQAQILNLLLDLRKQLSLTIIFISHQLSVISYVCDRVAVMYLGQFVESGRVADVFQAPQHPYTRALIDAHPEPDPAAHTLRPIAGDVPSLIDAPAGCRFQSRCSYAVQTCQTEVPPLNIIAPDHAAACFVLPFAPGKKPS